MSIPPISARFLLVCSGLLLACGLLVRLGSTFAPADHTFFTLILEDGYLIQTVARNIAVGKGMTVSDGTIPTNGIQPLATFLYAAGHWLMGGDKLLGIRFAYILQILAGLLTTWMIYRFALFCLSHREGANATAFLAAALWFGSDLTLLHTMNGQETVFLCAGITGTLWWYLRQSPRGDVLWTWKQSITLGLLLALCFWWRIDAVLFALSLGLFHVATRNQVVSRFRDMTIAASTMILASSPWLLYNFWKFGSPMPISGTSQWLTKGFVFKEELSRFLLGTLTVIGPVHQDGWWTILGCIVLVLIPIVFLRRHRNQDSTPFRHLLVVGLLYLAVMSTWYGYIYGAPWFLSRYLFPISVVSVIPLANGIVTVLAHFSRKPVIWLRPVILVIVTLLVVRENLVQVLVKPHARQHRGLATWVKENVDPEKWVGSMQSGAIGYFHDRTYNLDGKVDPNALNAHLERKFEIFLRELQPDYIVGWEQSTKWIKNLTGETYDFIKSGSASSQFVTSLLSQETSLPAGWFELWGFGKRRVYDHSQNINVLQHAERMTADIGPKKGP